VHAHFCNFQILGGTTINSIGDNVGTYACDNFGTCVLIDSYFDSSAPFTPIASDEEEIDVAPENPNANSAGGNTSSKTGATLSSCSGGFGGGSGGGGSSAPTLPPVITTAPRPERYVSVRPFYRAPANCNGGAPNGGSRAVKEKPEVKSTSACSDLEDVRSHAARVALDTALGSQAAGALRQAVVTTSDGYKEVWQRASFTTPYFLVTTNCPNPG